MAAVTVRGPMPAASARGGDEGGPVRRRRGDARARLGRDDGALTTPARDTAVARAVSA